MGVVERDDAVDNWTDATVRHDRQHVGHQRRAHVGELIECPDIERRAQQVKSAERELIQIDRGLWAAQPFPLGSDASDKGAQRGHTTS
jgi:hypothetical protein